MHWIERLNRDVTGRVPVLLDAEATPVEVLHWAHTPALPDNVPHRHTFYEICLAGRHGSGIFTAGGTHHAIAPGDLFFARPGVLHQIRNTGQRLMELAWVSVALLPQGAKSVPAVVRFAESEAVMHVPEAGHALSPLWYDALAPVAETAGIDTIRALASALLAVILHAGTDTPTVPTTPDTTHREQSHRIARIAVRYIHDNLNRAISVSEVAAQVHASPRHLTRLIERFTGVAPAAYIERARLDRAATLLSRTDTPIKQVAETVGYGSVHHFTRAFTRVQGVSPGAFRDSGDAPIQRGADTEGALV